MEAIDIGETKSFGEWLRHRRRELDLTQEELARQVGCARITIRKIEAEQLHPSKQLTELLRQQLGVVADESESFMHFARGGASAKSVATETPRHNLPLQLTSFVGREGEIAEIKRCLAENRLVTLTGPGGGGKTRLALEAANLLTREFKDGVWLTEFASLADASLVPQAVASTLGVQERQKEELVDELINHLRPRQTLLIFDNCEHLIEACAGLSERFLQSCPNLRILATSREPLSIAGETVWTVPPLSLPNPQPWQDIKTGQQTHPAYLQSEAVQLFIARASTAVSDFSFTEENGGWVAEICRRLDGMPLAIELAAARVRALSVRQIAERLDDRFNLLTAGSRTAPPRQQTLAATLDWSYALLDEDERRILNRLSIFAGGATLEAAESVCAGEGIDPREVLDGLSRLVDKSLVVAERHEEGGTRYRLLETIRQYAVEKLRDSGEINSSEDRHLNYFVQWAEKAEPFLNGKDEVLWINRFEAEHDNLRRALELSRTDPNKAATGLRLAAACGRFWRLHGHVSEGRARLTAALQQDAAQERSPVRAHALTLVANLMYLQGDYPAMRSITNEALSIWRELGSEGRAGTAFTLDLIGELATEEGNYANALVFYQEAIGIYRELNDPGGVSDILMQFGWAAMRTGDYPQAEQHLEGFLGLAQEIGDKTRQTYALSGLGEVAVRQGQYDRAVLLLEQALELSRLRGDKWGTGTMLGSLGWVALRRQDFRLMKELVGESLALRMEISDRGGIAWCLEKLAEAAFQEGDHPKAVKVLGGAATLRGPVGSVIDPADQPEYDRITTDLQKGLGQEAFEAAWADGKAMPLENIIEYALSKPEEPLRISSPMEKEKFGGLTGREREVARLIAQGKSNREIAEIMVVGVRTVETYVTRILNKLRFDSRVQIATWVVEKGLTTTSN